jgi:MFS family permease
MRLKVLPRAALALAAGTFVNRAGGFVLIFLVLYLTHRGFSPAAAGAALSAYGAGNVAASPAGGRLADRLGRKHTIVLSMLSGAVSLIALSQATGLAAVLALSALCGFTLELYRPASSALLADLVDVDHRLEAFALNRLAANAGVAAGAALAGVLAEKSFIYVFVLDAATCALFALVVVLAVTEPPRPATLPKGPSTGLLSSLRADPALRTYLLTATAIATVLFQAQSTLPLAVRANHLGPGTYGLLMTISGALIIVLQMPYARVARRFASRPTLAAGYLLTGAGFTLTALAHTTGPLIATVMIWTLGEIAFAPVGAAYLAGLAPPGLRGRYQGAGSLTWAVGLLIAPAIGPALYTLSPTAVWIGCGSVAAAAAWLITNAGAPPHTNHQPPGMTTRTPPIDSPDSLKPGRSSCATASRHRARSQGTASHADVRKRFDTERRHAA